jgi:hypothetical protein
MTIIKRDLEVVFYEHHNGAGMENRVLLSLGGGRAETILSLQEFCELLAECRKEISRLQWQSRTEEAQIGDNRQTER